MRRVSAYVILMVVLGAIAPSLTAQSILYVDASAGGRADGTSWQNAYTSLQDAMADASSGDEIWVAAGIYTPHADNRAGSFDLVDGVRLHGGFSGTESSLNEREPGAHRTILSGDLASDDAGFSMRDDNAYHVVRADQVGDDTLLEGFVVEAGHANGVEADSLGGGLLVAGGAPAVINVEFVGNYGRCGGGVAVTDSGAPELVNVVVNGNRALRGGGFCSLDASATIMNTTVTANTADSGAGLYNRDASPSLRNSIVSGNDRPDDIPECELMQYPCTIAQMSTAAREETLDLLEEARSILASSSLESAQEFLEEESSVVTVQRDGNTLVFRVRGGTPTFLDYIIVEQSSAPRRPSRLNSVKAAGSPGTSRSFEVVGEDLNGDSVVDNRDPKRALILAPHEWEFGLYDESRAVEGMLESLDPYIGNVTFVGNPDTLDDNMTLAHYESWDSYDVVYASTHGSRFCAESDFSQSSLCVVSISSGVTVSDVEVTTIPGVLYGASHFANQGTVLYEDNVFDLTLTSRTFRHLYGSSLDNTLIVLSACETGGRFASDFAEALGTDGLVMLGWSETVGIADANHASGRLMEEVSFGVTVEDGLSVLDEEGIGAFLNNDLETTELTRYAPGGGDQRIIELPSILYEGEIMQDGTEITPIVDGIIGDDEPDVLEITLLIRGVTEENRDDFGIRYEIDGIEASTVFNLSDAVEVDRYTYTVLHEVETGFPLVEGPLELDGIVDLPEGGESRFSVDAVLEGCYWNLTLGGDHAGEYEGDYATIVNQGGQYNLVTLNDREDPTPLIQLFIPILPEGASGPYMLGEGDEDDGSGRLNMTPVVTSPPFLYETGNSEDILHEAQVVYTEPDPSTLSIRASGPDATTGSVTGAVFGARSLASPSFDTADWTLEFQAENGLNPDGTPNITACGI